VAWWILFTAPLAVIVAMVTAAATTDDRLVVVLVFGLSVWAYVSALGFFADTESRNVGTHKPAHWVWPPLFGLLGAALAIALLVLTSELVPGQDGNQCERSASLGASAVSPSSSSPGTSLPAAGC
jgi:hypothetical protein